MGNYIGYFDKGHHVGERLGTNGSGMALCKLFAVAYGVSGLPDFRRALRATRAYAGADKHNPGKTVPSWGVSNRRDAVALLALDGELGGNPCFWVDFRLPGPCGGYFTKPPNCEIYRGVMEPLILLAMTDGAMATIPGSPTVRVANAWEAMLPFLTESPAYGKLTMMSAGPQQRTRR